MTRLIAIALAAGLASGCAVQRSVEPRVWPTSGSAPPTQGIPTSYVEKLPIGSKVKVSLRDGRSFSATLMGVEGDSVRLQQRTRIPEDPFLVPVANLAQLGLDEGGVGAVRAFLIGAGAGAATFFGLLILAAGVWAD